MFNAGTARSGARLAFTVGVVDLLSRLAVPAGALGLLHGGAELAVGAAVTVSVLAVVRGLASGVASETAVTSLWREVIDAARSQSVVVLSARGSDQNVWTLAAACHQLAEIEANVLPRLAADIVGIAVISLAVAMRMGAGWVLAGALGFALLGVSLIPLHKRFRREEELSHHQLSEVGLDLDVLLEAPAELRAHARDAAFAHVMQERVADMARARRRAHAYSSLVGLLPLGVALAAVALPLSAGELGLEGLRLAEAGVLGATALVFGIGILRGIETLARTAPQRDVVRSFLAASAAPTDTMGDAPRWRGTIELRSVSVVYPGSSVATPSNASFVWSKSGGLALLGENGSGKSTLALVVLGLVRPTSGAVLIDDQPNAESRLQSRVIYVPQRAYVSPTRSVRWHLELIGGSGLSDDELMHALHTVALDETLAKHAGTGRSALVVRAGELSGGELKRMHLARAFLEHSADLVVLDEPEAGLDPRSRLMLRGLVEKLAARARVLLIAQDPNVVPDAFQRFTCVRGPAG